jgi:hypothetical protein
MPLAQKTAALLTALSPADMEALTPSQRQRFAALCRHVAEMAEPSTRITAPKSGVLFALRNGHPRHE